ncbi:MAG: hypothetical protein SOT60_12200 [Bilifractor sp.]|nr:hypothetical protein [Bilifractor sp.]
MARKNSKSYTSAKRRVNSIKSGSVKYYRLQESYEDGNAVRSFEEETEEDIIEEARPKVSKRTKHNRARAKNMSAGYVLFLSAVCIVTVFLCIHYLQLRSDLTNQTEKIASMQNTLNQLKADNDAYYKATMASLSMDDVKDTALNKLNMHYATESQIRSYNAEDESYVRQYQSLSGENG